MPAALALQNGTPLADSYQALIKNVSSTFTLVYMMLCLAFYVVAVTISYRGYREFKYSSFNTSGRSTTQMQNPMSYGTLKD